MNLLLIWLVGVCLAVIFQCSFLALGSHVSARDAVSIVFFSLVWPAVLTAAAVTIAADTIHLVIKVARKPH